MTPPVATREPALVAAEAALVKTATPTKSLVSKLAEVMAAIERIPKRGHNSFHNYDYATEADIVAAIRQELAKRNLMLMPAITATHRESVGEKGSVLTHLTMEFTFIDGETGETLMRPWLGAGTDKEDKGAYKAMTGGEKYFLLKTFLIPTGDDPEATESDDTEKRDHAKPAPKAVSAPKAPPVAAKLPPVRAAAPRAPSPPWAIPEPPPITDDDIPFARR